MASRIYHHTLANGMTLLAEPMKDVRSAALNFLVPVGCIYDPPEQQGIASVLSDLITRGAGPFDSRQLTLALDNLGLDRIRLFESWIFQEDGESLQLVGSLALISPQGQRGTAHLVSRQRDSLFCKSFGDQDPTDNLTGKQHGNHQGQA